jgi:hypothetical protein
MKLKIFFAMVLLGSIITGCYYDVVTPKDPNKPNQNVSLQYDLQPIFSSECAISGCHAAGDHKPYLVADSAYTNIVSGGFVNTILPSNSILYQEISSGAMPPGGKLPDTDINLVLDWIKNGAPNN